MARARLNGVVNVVRFAFIALGLKKWTKLNEGSLFSSMNSITMTHLVLV